MAYSGIPEYPGSVYGKTRGSTGPDGRAQDPAVRIWLGSVLRSTVPDSALLGLIEYRNYGSGNLKGDQYRFPS